MSDDSTKEFELGDAEGDALRLLEPDLHEYGVLTADLFDMIGESLNCISGMRLSMITQSKKVAVALLNRLGNDLRCVALVALRGYHTQAAALTASMYEVTYALIYIGKDDSRAQEWINHKDPTKPFRSIFQLTKDVVTILGIPDGASHTNRQYKIYRQLAMTKHANPLFEMAHAYDVSPKSISVMNGPRTSPDAVRAGRFALEQAAGLAFMALATFVKDHVQSERQPTLTHRLDSVSRRLEDLKQQSIARYGTDDPFPGKW